MPVYLLDGSNFLELQFLDELGVLTQTTLCSTNESPELVIVDLLSHLVEELVELSLVSLEVVRTARLVLGLVGVIILHFVPDELLVEAIDYAKH